MKQLLPLFGSVAIGVVLTKLAGLDLTDSDSEAYSMMVTGLLAVGLYGATFGIDLGHARRDLRIILSAITIGVALKAAFIATSITLLVPEHTYLLLGIVVAQIDPLSVAGVMQNGRLSARARSILGSWASFDDPVTVLMAFYLAPALAIVSATAPVEHIASTKLTYDYLVQLVENLLFAAGSYAAWRCVRDRNHLIVATVLAAVFVVAIWQSYVLGIAVVGLFFRPAIDTAVDKAVRAALIVASIVLGVGAATGVDIAAGAVLGAAAFVSQIVAAALLTRGLPRNDRLHLAFAQQNGITAVILALTLEPLHPGTIRVVAPAIVAVNVVHWAANAALDRHLAPVR